MSTDPPPGGPERVAPGVAVIVVADEAAPTRACLEAVGRQVYEPAQVVVVGGDDEIRHIAGEHEARWRPNLRAVGDALPAEAELLWLIAGRAQPRPDALRTLVADLERVDASVAGSKILDAEDPSRLVSVGYATDVFAAPFSGLQPGEVDQEQYDVVRDVAAVSMTSMLIRRDLYQGLRGPDPVLAPLSAAVDLCQRARLRGARVIVSPSSEVLLSGEELGPDWRERAGEFRAMVKSFSAVTLLWAVPLSFLVGLAEALGALFLGSFRITGFLVAWLRGLVLLPSSIAARIAARRGRVAGDEELFRFQVNGSARLRVLYDQVLERTRRRFPEGVLAGFIDVVESGQQRLRRPAVVAGIALVVFAVAATRAIWTGRLPAVGFSLPPPDDAVEALRAYAGGWNPAGLGSPEVLRPAVAGTALVQLATLGRSGAAVSVLTVGAFLAGGFGTARLLRVWGIGSVSGLTAGIVLMAGPAAAALGDATQWAALVGLAGIPWAMAGALAPWPERFVGRISRLASTALATGIVGVFAPAALPVPVAAVALWAIVGRGPRWPAAGRALLGTATALPLLMPWILYADLPGFYTDGRAAFWEPSTLVVGVFAATCIAAIVAADRARAPVAGWSGLLVVAGALVARAGDLGAGREALVAGLAAASLGTAVLVGVALEAATRRHSLAGLRRATAVVAAAGAAVLTVTTVATLAPGRAGLPEDTFTGTYGFAAAAEGAQGRVLVFGPAETLPGTSYDYEGLAYRVFTPPVPRTWSTYLPDQRLGDNALVELFDDLVSGRVRRAGERLADFGIGWVLFTEDSPLESLFEAQLDLVPLRSLDSVVFRNEVPAARATAADGTAWRWDGTAYRLPEGAPASGTLYVAENGDRRWGPGEWEQAGWANRITVAGDTVRFSGHTGRRSMAVGSAGWLGALLVAALVGRRRT